MRLKKPYGWGDAPSSLTEDWIMLGIAAILGLGLATLPLWLLFRS